MKYPKMQEDSKEAQILELLLMKNHGDKALAEQKLAEFGLTPLVMYVLGSDTFGKTFLHALAESGKFDALPDRVLTKEYLALKDLRGETIFHVAARHGNLENLPESLLTEEMLIQPNKANLCALEIAREHNHLDQLLGITFSEKVRDLVGIKWHEKNSSLCKNKDLLTQDQQEQDIEIF